MYTLAKKKPKKSDFQNAVIPQPVDGFLCSTPEMKARDAYVPFLILKPINKKWMFETFERTHKHSEYRNCECKLGYFLISKHYLY